MMAHTVRSVPLSIFKDQGPPVDTILLWPPFPVSWALWIFKLRLRFVQIWVRWVKSRTKFQKYKLAQNDEISFVLFEISSFGRLLTIPQQKFLHWMWNYTLFEPISLRSVRFWGRPLRVSYLSWNSWLTNIPRAFSSESCLHTPSLGLASWFDIQFFLQQPGVP